MGNPTLWSLGILAALALVARLGLANSLPAAQCWLRQLTGIPCPTCGCTRSLAAWPQLDPMTAFQLNPLFSLVVLAGLGWVGLRVVQRVTGRPLLPRRPEHLNRWPLWTMGLGLIALNWVYLCLKLPN